MWTLCAADNLEASSKTDGSGACVSGIISDMNNDHWKDPWSEAPPEELRAEVEKRLSPEMPVELHSHAVLPPDVMLLLPNSNPHNLSPQEMIEQGEAVAGRIEGWWNDR